MYRMSTCPEAKDMQITVDCLLLSPLVSMSPKQWLSESINLSNK